MSKCFIVVISFISLLSCRFEPSTNDDDLGADSKFILKDSIVVDYLGNLQITDYLEDKQSYLGLDLSNNSIIQFNKDGDILYEPIIGGEGPEDIRGTIYSLGYSKSNSLLAQTRTFLYELNFQGDILKKIKLPDGDLYTMMRLTNSVIGDKVLLLHDNNTDLRPIFRDYFHEVRNITVIDMKTEQVTFEVPFEDSSLYKNNDYYYRITCPSFVVNTLDSSVYVLYPYEKKIYQYDFSKGFLLMKVIETNPEHFKEPEKARFGSDFNIMKSVSYDSYYLNIYNNRTYTLLEYVTGMPKTISQPGSIAGLNELLTDHNNRYYQVFKNGEKIGYDIERPSGMMDLRYFHQNNQAVFQLDKRKAERDYEVFYLYEVDFL
jgi:hypothetical protein